MYWEKAVFLSSVQKNKTALFRLCFSGTEIEKNYQKLLTNRGSLIIIKYGLLKMFCWGDDGAS